MLPPCPLTAIRFSKPWWASESQTSRKTWKNVVVDSRTEPGNCMWYQLSVTFSVGATRIETPSCSPRSAARAASDRAMTQSVSSGMWGPCCSVVPMGIHCVDAGIDPPLDFFPGHPLDEVLGHQGEFDVPNVRLQTRSNDRGGFRGRDDRGQRRQPVAPDHGRGGAGDPDPRRGLRPFQPRS